MAKSKRDIGAAPAEPNQMVRVRVTKMGDGKISTGKHDPRGGDEKYEAGEMFAIGKGIADQLEAKGYAEIQSGKAAG